MFVTALCKLYVIWTFHCTGNKAFMKVYEGFIVPQILKSRPVPRAPKLPRVESCSALQNFSWRPCLWDKEKNGLKTGDLLKEVQFI
jgi:hypothetical protein